MADILDILFYTSLIASVLSMLLSYVVWQRRPAAGASVFSLMMLATAIWTGAYAIEISSAAFDAKMFWSRISHIGVILVPVLWFSFANQYSKIKFLQKKSLYIIVGIPALVYLVLIWTNDIHHLYWSETRLVTVEGLDVLFAEYGPGFWGNLIFSYSLLLVGSVVIGWTFLRSAKIYWSQAFAVIVSILINWLALGVDVFMLLPSARYYSLTPFGVALSGLGLSWALYYFRLFDLAPVARNIVLESMLDGVIILDTQQRIVEVNQAAIEYLGLRQEELIGFPVERALGSIPEFDLLKVASTNGTRQARLIRRGDEIHLEIQTTAIYNSRGDLVGTLLVMRNISRQYAALDVNQSMQVQYEELRSRFDELIDRIPAPIFGFSKEQRLIFGNQAFREFAGVNPAVENTVSLDEVLAKVKNSQVYLGVLKVLETGKSRPVNSWWNDRYFEFEITATLWGVLIVAKDSTEEKKLSSKMLRYSDRIEGFRQIDQAILAAKSPDTIAKVALEHIVEIVPSDFGSVMLYKVEDSEGIILAAWNRQKVDHQTGKKLAISFDQVSLELRRGKCLLVDDAQQTMEPIPGFLAEIFPERIGSILCVPLIAQGEFVGTMNLGSEKPDVYQQDHNVIAQEIANSLAIGIQNARLFSETISSLAGEARLNQVARIISSSLDINQILLEVTRHTVELCGADAGALGLISNDGQILETPYLHNFPPDVYPITTERGQGIAWKIIESRQAIALRQYSDHPQAVKTWVDWGVKGFLGVPIAAGDNVLGALGLFCFDQEKTFSQRDISIAKSIGRQAGVAIQNARYFELANQRAREAETLRKSGALVASSLNIFETIQHIFIELSKVINYDRGSVYQVEDGRLMGKGFAGDWGSSIPEAELISQVNDAYDQILQTKEPLNLRDAGEVNWRLRLPPGSWLGIPLINHQNLTGLLCLECDQKNAFDDHQVSIASAFADHVAIAIENARLFHDVQKLSLIDPETGSFSSKFFFELADREFERAKRYKRPLSMILLRISWRFSAGLLDGFTDEKNAWRKISKLIQGEIRKVDDFARYDDASFIILLPESTLDDGTEVVGRLNSSISEFIAKNEICLKEPVFEIGIAECNFECGSMQDFYMKLLSSIHPVIDKPVSLD